MKEDRFLILLVSGAILLAGCSSSSRDVSKLKEELKQEILAELRRQDEVPEQNLAEQAPAAVREQDSRQRKAQTERDDGARAHNQAQRQPQTTPYISTREADVSVQVQPGRTGRAEGYILRGGKGLGGCQVKLVRILKGHSRIQIFNAVRESPEFTTTTDEQGKYSFDDLPVGSYKLKWLLPGDDGWIRRLRDKPDAVVGDGQTAGIKAVETNRRLVGQ